MAVISGDTGIVFAGYLDDAEEMLTGGKRRVLFIADDFTAAQGLPHIGDTFSLPGGTGAPVAAGSIGIVPGAGGLVLSTDDNWRPL